MIEGRGAMRILVSLLGLYLGVIAGCERCGSGQAPVLGTLSARHGELVTRDFAGDKERWQAAALGSRFVLGDGLRTGADSTAVVELSDGSSLRVGQNSLVRFLVDAADDAQSFDVRTGDALLMSGKRPLRLRTHVGLATLSAGSQVQLSRQGQNLEYRVDIGELRFRNAAGEFVAIKAGDSIEVGIGMAVLRARSGRPVMDEAVALGSEGAATPAPYGQSDPAREPGPTEPEPTEPGPTEPEIATAEERVEVGAVKTGPSYFHLSVRAGESFTVHAAETPVAVGFAFDDKCAGEGEVELLAGNQRSRAEGSANLLLQPGRRSYVLRCVSAAGKASRKVAARGTARVLRDPGTHRLPARPPTSFIDADGRGYTVYFQNQLPDVSVRWPGAPEAGQFRLTVDDKTFTTPAPSHLFASGELLEGLHKLTFLAAGRRSRTTTVDIRFDNAAPKASLSAPVDRAFDPGDRVKVAGVALPTWKVSVDGGTIVMGGNDRFSGEVVTSIERPDIAVRLRHPRLGTHYYLRRAKSSP
jgi:hypothetical protein